ncbi:sensor histidine kinase [Conexibacter stalactiti]|uniref:Sensor histidine kinase n=1 Tax=Conexibacter stalactiti TaxID=1940611 RepID=A0ABU4HX24_9ACTN|nr:sensor histidine kinase [Conexibacter stalactiti]MDW5597863.1 sensor histidine kinase [Conexibacter stalactiti]MEC5038505.1 sensor histidine kinase [Conexibacter stalactiti]
MSSRSYDVFAATVTDPTPTEARKQLAGVLLGMGWLAIPIVETVGSSPAWWRAMLASVLFGVAVALYLTAVMRPPNCGPQQRHELRPVYLSFAAIAAIAALLTVVVTPAWAILFSYASVLSGLHLPTRHAVPLLFASAAAALVLTLGQGAEGAVTYAVSALGVGALMLALGRLIAANVQLQTARQTIEQLAVEAERERFARDLHDVLGHSLSVVTLKAELAGRLLPRQPQEAQRHVRELEQVARAALGELRETVSGYRRPTLAGELAGARLALDAAGIELHLEQRAPELPAEVEALLAWTVREGTTNVIRHSGARRCAIAIAPVNGSGVASAEIRDDGRGVRGDAPGGPGNGLEGLRERAAQLAGRIDAETPPDGGFRLTVTVPAR